MEAKEKREVSLRDATVDEEKFLTFSLGEESYGIEILTVREIVGLLPVTPVPQAPFSVRGVVNLRGQVIPVVDLRLRFGMEGAEDTDETCIIVVQFHEMQLGVVVDRVSEVLDIARDDIVAPDTLGSEINTESLLGIGKTDGRVTLLLDIARIFATEELAEVARVA